MTPKTLLTHPLLRLACLLSVALLVSSTGIADDRDLVKDSGEEPYLFVIFDVSGSMNWTPPGFGPDGVQGTADDLPSDRWAPGYGDDPNSKFYQAKSALFQVVSDPDLQDINWGFATYNQDRVRAYRKHYLYSPVEAPPWADDLPYPMPGMPKHFGDICMDDLDNGGGCDLDGSMAELAGTTLGTCGAPQNLANQERFGELLSVPALGWDGQTETTEWVGWQGREFQLTWHQLQVGSNLGDDNPVAIVSVQERDGCGTWLPTVWTDVKIELTKTYPTDTRGRDLPGANEVLVWQGDGYTDSAGNPSGFHNVQDTRTTNTCAGWESIFDAGADTETNVSLKYPRTTDPYPGGPRHAWALDRGDVIPFDWEDQYTWGTGNGNRDLILRRLAPSFDGLDYDSADFRVAPYFEDLPDTFTSIGGTGRLALKPAYVNTPPLLPSGSTPIGNSMYNFMQWYDQWKPVATGPNGDDRFGCRTVNLLILSDGDETCYGGGLTGTTDGGGDRNPCWIADLLLNQNDRNIRTFIIGFGLAGSNANFLNCIAQRGGTDAIDLDNDGVTDLTGPILPGNEQELVDALKQIANAVKSQSRSFASAAVPQAQVNVDDKVYLTAFMPLAEESIWPGRMDAYLRPVPLRTQDVVLPDGSIETRLVPDPTQSCGPTDESQCHIWNAGDELLLQAADDNELLDPTPFGGAVGDGYDRGIGGSGTLNLGTGELNRRVYYAVDRDDFQLPDQRRFFKLDASDSDALWQDMVYGLDLCVPGDVTCETGAGRLWGTRIMNWLHMKKNAEDPNNLGTYFDYLQGDFFHSDPLVYGNPDEFAYWVADVEGSGGLPLQDPCDVSPNGYRCFFAKHRYRRKVVIAGTNDGQAHIYDAGFFRGPSGADTGLCRTNPVTSDAFVVGDFDNGTGRELFSYVPRTTMAKLDDLMRFDEHEFTVDGRIARGDVFIDPLQETGAPDPDEREWRSTIVGTLREGGPGLYAIDITQPDQLIDCDGLEQIPQALSGTLDYVPSCTNGGTGCGTTRYPEVLWEFEDSKDCVEANLVGFSPGEEYTNRIRTLESSGTGVRCDDDGNGLPDLADSWSRPTIGRIRVNDLIEGEVVDKYVAVFGGGMDSTLNKDSANVGGNFLFMVDMETGRAIYKRAVVGSVPSDPAVVDTDQDGYLDTVFFGTTAGFLYKADIRSIPDLEDLGVDGGLKITSTDWEPFPVLTSGGRPFYHEPTVIFVPDLGQYAIALGTGDREDLWEDQLEEGRFYMFIDRDFASTDAYLPLTETDLQQISLFGANTTSDFLRRSPYGWYLVLQPGERLISEAFSLAGVTIFSTFEPLEAISDDGAICQRFGNSNVYVVTTTSANTLLSSDERFFTIEGGYLSPPFAETSQTKNPSSGDGGPTADDLPDDMVSVVEEIKGLLPTGCKYANYTINIKAVRDDTGIQFLAAIPVCTVETNWKDF